MKRVFVVLTDAMGGLQLGGVYADEARANGALPEAFGKNPRVLPCAVAGDQPDENVVFTAETFDRSMDVHNFEGVYGNYDAACAAAGPKGQVLQRKL